MSILKQRYMAPKLSFELGLVTKSILLGQSATIWNSQIYNSEYNVDIISDSPFISSDNMKFKLTPLTIGEYKIQLQVSNKFRKVLAKSNTITLMVE